MIAYYPLIGRFCLISLLVGVLSPGATFAQISPDPTLGQERSNVTRTTQPGGRAIDRIEGGAIRGRNLFHSFQDFNVGAHQSVYFSNPTGIDNILSRVTGGTPSQILGTLGVLGNANLFLLNPNGILFGENARLDIRGSFIASTANSILFERGLEFNATNPQAPPLLTIEVPMGLQFGSQTPAPIINMGQLSAGQNLSLISGTVVSTGTLAAQGSLAIATVPATSQMSLSQSYQPLNVVSQPLSATQTTQFPEATNVNRGLALTVSGDVIFIDPQLTPGDVAIQQLSAQSATIAAYNNLILTNSQLSTASNLSLLAQNTVQVRDSITHPAIISAGGELQVQGDRIDLFALNHPGSGLYSGGHLILRSSNPVGGDAHYFAGGDFRIERLDGTLGDLFSPYDPVILSRGNVTVNAYIGTSLHILAGGSVTFAGDVLITGPDLIGRTIHPNDPVLGELATAILPDGTTLGINGIASPSLDVRAGVDQAVFDRLFASGLQQNNGTNNANIFPPTQILADTVPPRPLPTSAAISVGNVQINAPNGTVFLSNRDRANPNLINNDIAINGVINTSNTVGNSGSVTIDSRANLILNNGINTASEVGNAGAIALFAQENLNINAPLDASSSAGDSGNIRLFANNGNLSVANRSILSEVDGAGNSNGVNITARSLNLLDGATISTRTFGAGSAGNIEIAAEQSVQIIGTDAPIPGGLLASSSGSGSAGRIAISTPELTLQNQAIVDAATIGIGQGGAVNLNVSGTANITNGRITVETTNTGNAGILNINTGQLNVGGDTQISANTSADGQGGSINIQANQIALRDQSQVSTNASGNGRGGTIELNGDRVTLQNEAQLLAQTFGAGNAGSVTVNAQQLTMIGDEIVSANSNGTGIFATSALNTQGNAGSVALNISGAIDLNNASIFANTNGSGSSGNINVEARQLTLQNGAEFSIRNGGTGAGGHITVNTRESVNLLGTDREGLPSGFFLGTSTAGGAGTLQVDTRHLLIRDGAIIESSTSGVGQAGDIAIRATDTVQVIGEGQLAPSGIVSEPNRGNTGNAGNISITTGRFIIRNGGNISTQTIGAGQAGNITVNALERVEVTGVNSRLNLDTSGLGNAGELQINTPQLFIQEGGLVSAQTASAGSGGRLIVNAPEVVEVSGAGSTLRFNSIGSGNAQGISIATGQLRVQNQGNITVSGEGSGFAGNLVVDANSVTLNNQAIVTASTVNNQGGAIDIRARDSVSLNGGSELSSQASGSGNAGRMQIVTDRLRVEGNSELTVRAGSGNAGNLRIIADTVRVNNANITAETETGTGGSIELRELNRLDLANGAISTSTESGRAGNVAVMARSAVVLRDNSRVSSDATVGNGRGGNVVVAVQSGDLTLSSNSRVSTTASGGQAGNITVTGNRVNVQTGSAISSSTVDGSGGRIQVNADEAITLTNRGRITSEATGGGNAGQVTLTTDQLTMRNGARVSVAAGAGDAGDLRVRVRQGNLVMSNNSDITALTESGTGGNIVLNVANDILLSSQSDIIAAARTGVGGNMNITARFILTRLSENSDIIASALDAGRGGRIIANADLIRGFREFGGIRSPESDFTANSINGLPGTLELTIRDNIRLEALPENFLDDTILQGCDVTSTLASDRHTSTFVIRGRGGLVERPEDLFSGEAIAIDLVTPVAHTDAPHVAPVNTDSASNEVSEVSSDSLIGQLVLGCGLP